MFIVAYSFANPCCNGITMELLAADQKEEDKRRLDPCYNGMTMEYFLQRRARDSSSVLILVIME